VKRIYIAGPMRGMPQLNFPAFDKARDFFRNAGWEVYSPADIDRAAGISEATWDDDAPDVQEKLREVARRDFDALIQCDAIALLEGWERSRGVAWERPLADFIKLEIYDAETGLLLNPFVFHPPRRSRSKPDQDDAYGSLPLMRDLLTPNKKETIRNGRFVVKDSGDRHTFATGAVRDAREGKGFFHCIPYVSKLRLAQLFEAGARKYGKDNWKKGINLSCYVDGVDRHNGKLAECWQDEDHAAAVMWNAACFIWTVEQIRAGRLPQSLDDIGWFAAEERAAWDKTNEEISC
jgi:hypothetical protein